jgi:hypothetical protein
MEEINRLEKEIQANKATLETKKNEVAEELRKKYPILWGIRATPSDRRHVEHTVDKCIFTTKEKAQASCRDSSHDYDDRVTWYYKVIPIESSEVSVDDLLHLDQNRGNYPYTGW